MTEVLFYHLQRQPIEKVLPQLLEKSIERGWRVIVESPLEDRIDALDAHLWTYRDDSFLAHGTYREGEAPMQPVLLTVHEHNPNQASVRFLIDGAPVPSDASSYQRIVLLFDGEDDAALAAARERWTECKANGFEATYWQCDENGRWQKKA
jgi:DNA polymerase III subunit chi